MHTFFVLVLFYREVYSPGQNTKLPEINKCTASEFWYGAAKAEWVNHPEKISILLTDLLLLPFYTEIHFFGQNKWIVWNNRFFFLPWTFFCLRRLVFVYFFKRMFICVNPMIELSRNKRVYCPWTFFCFAFLQGVYWLRRTTFFSFHRSALHVPI